MLVYTLPVTSLHKKMIFSLRIKLASSHLPKYTREFYYMLCRIVKNTRKFFFLKNMRIMWKLDKLVAHTYLFGAFRLLLDVINVSTATAMLVLNFVEIRYPRPTLPQRQSFLKIKGNKCFRSSCKHFTKENKIPFSFSPLSLFFCKASFPSP